MTASRITALIADDEPLAREFLKRQLERQSVEVVGEAIDAAEALRLAAQIRPDVLFLDVRMPGLTGIQCANLLLHTDLDTLIVFVTAHTRFAVDAFEHGALDYLVKPVVADRLAATLVRVRSRMTESLNHGLAKTSADQAPRSMGRSARLPIREEYGIRLVPLDEIQYVTARDKRVHVSTVAGEFKATYTLSELETMLPEDQFFRIHDSWIVNLDRIEELCFLGNHSYLVRLQGNQQLPVSRYRYSELQRRLGIDERRRVEAASREDAN